MKALNREVPFKWPFPPRRASCAANPRTAPRAGQPSVPQFDRLTSKRKLADILLVIFWGASIPGLMWLAAAGGF